MIRPLRPVVLAVLLALAWVAASSAQNQRAMYVSVVNAQGAPVTDLGPADFVVREDGAVREVVSAVPATDPMQIALVVDNSQAAQEAIPDIRHGLDDLVTAITKASEDETGPNQISIITIADRPTIETHYTTDRAALLKGIQRLFPQPESGMYLLDALVDVIHGFDARNASRPVIVAVITEGVEFSTRYYTDVTKALADARAALYVFTMGPPATDTRDETNNRNMVISEGTKASGGAWEPVVSSVALSARLKQLAAQLTHEYRITYGSPESLIPPQHITVEVKRPGLTARGTPVKVRKQ